MTRFELGQAFTSYRIDRSLRFCFGTDGKFPEIHTIKYDLSQDASDKILFESLEETCLEAIRLTK